LNHVGGGKDREAYRQERTPMAMRQITPVLGGWADVTSCAKLQVEALFFLS
jgi:hypothetical protein